MTRDGYLIEQEDATRYLPHSPIDIEYEHFVFQGEERNVFTGQMQRRRVFTGSRAECEAYVSRVTA